MNKERFQSALNYIGDDLIAEAADYRPKAAGSKPGLFVKYGKAFACTAAVLAAAVGFKIWADIKFGGVSLENTANDNISSIIDEVSKSTNKSDIDSIMDNIDQIMKDGESSPGKRFSPVYGKGDPTFENWCDFDNVTWYSYDFANKFGNKDNMTVDDDAFNMNFKFGSAKMSAILYNAITAEYDAEPIFAVRVYFSTKSYTEDMDSWKYKGMTIREISKKTYDPYNAESADKLYELLDDAEYDYYLVQMQRIYENDFEPRNLEIYPIEKGSTIKGYNWFYCFMRAQQIASLKCKFDEAFYLDLSVKPTN